MLGLKVFDRVHLLYHVAQAGWGAALEGIYPREFWAVIIATILAPARTLILSDNEAVMRAITRGHGHTLSPYKALATLVLLVNKGSWVAWVPTDLNPADNPSRLHLT